MKKLIFTFCYLFLTISLEAQTQSQIYSRIKINLDTQHALADLARLGMEVDHGQLLRDISFTGEFSATELAQMTQSGFSFEVLIPDLKAHFLAQSANNSATETVVQMEGDCPNSVFDKQYPTPQNYVAGTYAGYFRYQEMLDILDQMHALYPNIVTQRAPISNTLQTIEGRDIWYVRLSDNPDQNEDEPEVLYTAVHHAREPNSMSANIFYMWYLLEHYAAGDPEVVYLVENTELYFVPCLNPDGYIYNETTDPAGGGLWRKNRRDNGDGTFGVDLNRNYSYNWGVDDNGSSPFTNSETYRGTAPFSEPETQMIRNFVNEHQFQVALNYHTYSNLMLHPWGYSPEQTPDHEQFEAIGKAATKHNAYTEGGTGAILYLANGGSDDWMYGGQDEHDKIYAYTPEVGPAYWGFWPPADAIDMLNKAAMTHNLTAAHAVHPYAQMSTDQTSVLENLTGSIPFAVRRIGLVDGPVTVTLTGLTPNVISTGQQQVFNLTTLETQTGGISYELDEFTDFGEQVGLELSLSNGIIAWHDTLQLVYGSANELINLNGNSTGPWATLGWGVDAENPYSPTGSLADSPGGAYNANTQSAITTSLPVNLNGANKAFLEYRARWELEGDRDYVQVNSIVLGNTTALCGRYTSAAAGNFQPIGEPVYDGSQPEWVLERIDISTFIPQSIRIQFVINTDDDISKKGFNFDDLRIITVADSVISAVDVLPASSPMLILPNPATDVLHISLVAALPACTFSMTDVIGHEVRSLSLTSSSYALDIADLPSGFYLCLLRDAKGSIIAAQKVVVE